MKHKILGVAALLCAMLFAACSDLLEDLTPKETSSVEVETTADTDLYVHILEISGDFTLESEQSGTELRFTALDTEPGANLVWKVYKGLEDTAYTQSGSDTSFGFDTGDLEPGKYTLLVTSGTRSATVVFTVNTTVTVPVTLKTGGAINSILMQLCKAEWEASACTKFARSVTNNEKATLYLDTEEKYIPVWSEDTEVYYYVPDGCTPVMNEDSSKMFYCCTELTSLDVDGFDTSKVTDMSSMFGGCYHLTSLDLSKFDTGNVKNMSEMFGGCSGLTSLDLGSFDTGNVTNMSGMFSECRGLTSLDLSKFDTSKVENMSNMFSGCAGRLDLSSFNTSNVTDMSYMFSGYVGRLDLSSFDTSKVTDMSFMFTYCDGLTTIYATDKFVTTSVTSGDDCFHFCMNLKGGAGTTWNSSRESADYARIDGGTDAPGYFTLKLGSKSKPDAVGDIVFSDGSATAYTADLTLTEEQKSKAVAVIFYAGSASDTLGAKTLGVGLVQGTDLAWATGTTGFGTEFATSDTDGSGNWKVIVDAADKLTGVAADAAKMEVAAAETSYPAFNFANTYGVSVAGVASGWYLPAKDELNNLCDSYRADGSAVKEALDKCTGTINLSTGIFWSSSQGASNSSSAWYVGFGSGTLTSEGSKNAWYSVCAVRAFN